MRSEDMSTGHLQLWFLCKRAELRPSKGALYSEKRDRTWKFPANGGAELLLPRKQQGLACSWVSAHQQGLVFTGAVWWACPRICFCTQAVRLLPAAVSTGFWRALQDSSGCQPWQCVLGLLQSEISSHFVSMHSLYLCVVCGQFVLDCKWLSSLYQNR